MSSQMKDSNSKYGEYVRATDEFPAGEQCELTCDDVPDEESEFGTTAHYDDRRKRRTNPEVTNDVVDTLINDSDVREAPGDDWDNRYLFQSTIESDDGRTYEWTLVVADDEKPEDRSEDEHDRWVLITIYSNWHGSVGTTNEYIERRRKRQEDG